MADSSGIVPAQLGFLAIFNPSLGNTDETVDDQIVYYTSLSSQSRSRRPRWKYRPADPASQEERNERLRQIGLAQGMVEFGKGFSDGQSVDTIDTEKSRVILHELEPGWWILASVDLTRLPVSPNKAAATAPTTTDDPPSQEQNVEYSSREVKPTMLLLQDLLRAHSIFLLHHDSSLSSMFMRVRRHKFVNIVARYWDLFLSTWNVLLHGNPVRNSFGGIKIAACGELGVGVGEEERGSGEREVLEGLVGRIDGLVDLVVSRFGEYDFSIPPETESGKTATDSSDNKEPWLGSGRDPGGEDGAIFLGTGSLSRNSVRDITYWMEDLYTWGEEAYGVEESPTSTRPPRRSRKASVKKGSEPPFSPPPPVTELAKRPKQATPAQEQPPSSPANASSHPEAEANSTDKVMSYLKLGYGTYWGAGTGGEEKDGGGASDIRRPDPIRPPNDAQGHYLIGLKGQVEDAETEEEDDRFADTIHEEYNSRTLLRTLIVELEGQKRRSEDISKILGSGNHELGTRQGRDGDGGAVQFNVPFDNQDSNKTRKLRVVVYVNKPFIFAFLFELHTDSLAWDRLYKSLHHQLAPLRKPLALSTAYRPDRPDAGSAQTASIYDLVWDRKALTVHSTIPNIPEPDETSSLSGSSLPLPWTRVEALNTHMMILNLYMSTRAESGEQERTCKTARGWWIVWSRVLERLIRSGPASPESEIVGLKLQSATSGSQTPGGDVTPRQDFTVSKEIFLIRKASDHSGASALKAVAAASGGGWTDGASRLAQGIGVDTKKYIEGLLSLHRTV